MVEEVEEKESDKSGIPKNSGQSGLRLRLPVCFHLQPNMHYNPGVTPKFEKGERKTKRYMSSEIFNQTKNQIKKDL